MRLARNLLGHAIPAGTHITLSPGATHRLPGYWSSPDDFD
ncbi:MAG: cytochrome P450, partial [Polyangiaceae bacterium]|nr:cytochrome P450 [Polyangiaceae bacterium]